MVSAIVYKTYSIRSPPTSFHLQFLRLRPYLRPPPNRIGLFSEHLFSNQMSATRVASRGQQLLSWGGSQCGWRGLTTSPACQRRALSKTPRAARLQPSGFSTARNISAWSQSTKYVSARRTFSSTPAAAHGDWSPPKPGEE